MVDLDGTLILTDMLHESSLQLLRDAPWGVFAMPLWLFQGKASLKQQIGRRVQMDASALPYNEPFVRWLRAQHAAGRRTVLCTASDRTVADAIALHLGCFDEVMASAYSVSLLGDFGSPVIRATRDRFERLEVDLRQVEALDRMIVYLFSHYDAVRADPPGTAAMATG